MKIQCLEFNPDLLQQRVLYLCHPRESYMKKDIPSPVPVSNIQFQLPNDGADLCIYLSVL